MFPRPQQQAAGHVNESARQGKRVWDRFVDHKELEREPVVIQRRDQTLAHPRHVRRQQSARAIDPHQTTPYCFTLLSLRRHAPVLPCISPIHFASGATRPLTLAFAEEDDGRSISTAALRRNRQEARTTKIETEQVTLKTLMDYETFASDLPRSNILTFTSAEENEETMQRLGVDQQMRQLGCGKFQCDMAVREFEDATLVADRLSKACSIKLGPPPGTVALAIFRSAGAELFADGTDVANDKMVFYPDGSQTDLLTRDLFGSDSIMVSQTRFDEMLETLCPTSVRPESATIVGGNTTQLRRLRDAIVWRLARPDSEVNEEDLSDLVAAAVTWMGHSSSSWLDEKVTSTVAHVWIAKRAQEYIEEHYREPLHIEDLCRATGVGVRTLQRSFREHFQLTVREYLKTVRLDAALRALAVSAPQTDTVASIAFRNGFTHLGRFSVEFHQRFGQTALKTLGIPTHPGIYFRRGAESSVERTHGQLLLPRQPAETTA